MAKKTEFRRYYHDETSRMNEEEAMDRSGCYRVILDDEDRPLIIDRLERGVIGQQAVFHYFSEGSTKVTDKRVFTSDKKYLGMTRTRENPDSLPEIEVYDADGRLTNRIFGLYRRIKNEE